jgi:dihydroorotate dehydrogenase electron transfer subunit
VILGAKTASTLLFKEKILKMGLSLSISTDDGSQGYHGTVVDVAEKVVQEIEVDKVFTCGPEKMMKKIVDLAHQFSLPVEASLERWMKCGIGICDSCAVNGFHVCKDGPVFSGEKLQEINEFGKWHRLPSGKRISF